MEPFEVVVRLGVCGHEYELGEAIAIIAICVKKMVSSRDCFCGWLYIRGSLKAVLNFFVSFIEIRR